MLGRGGGCPRGFPVYECPTHTCNYKHMNLDKFLDVFVGVRVVLSFADQVHVSLSPKELQKVCSGQSLAYTCTSTGRSMELFVPPFINQSDAFRFLYQNQNITQSLACNVRMGAAAVFAVAETSNGLNSVTGILTLTLPSDHLRGSYNVNCRVSTTQSDVTMMSTFSVMDSKVVYAV